MNIKTPNRLEKSTKLSLDEKVVQEAQEATPQLQKRWSETDLEDEEFMLGQNSFSLLSSHEEPPYEKVKNDEESEPEVEMDIQDYNEDMSRQVRYIAFNTSPYN